MDVVAEENQEECLEKLKQRGVFACNVFSVSYILKKVTVLKS